jgi:type IV pilus assembly protein PilV
MNTRGAQLGFTMLEILVSLLIIVVGLLGILGLQAQAMVAEFESYQRGQALILVQDMVDRINTNRRAVLCYVITDAAGSPQLGSGSAATVCAAPATGTPATRATATQDLVDWHEALRGAAERTGGAAGTRVGTILGARGCVSFDAATNLYRVAVAWQGMTPTISPVNVDATANCGVLQYGNDAGRREIGVRFRIANLAGA